MVFDFNRYIKYTSYNNFTEITLRDFSNYLSELIKNSNIRCTYISSGLLYIITSPSYDYIEEVIISMFSDNILINNDNIFLGYIITPIKYNNDNYYKIYAKLIKKSSKVLISSSEPVLTYEEYSTPSFYPTGDPIPGYVVRADEEGKPQWSPSAGIDPLGDPLPNRVIKVDPNGIIKWLPDSSDNNLIVTNTDSSYKGYVLAIDKIEDDKMICKWVNANSCIFENPEGNKNNKIITGDN